MVFMAVVAEARGTGVGAERWDQGGSGGKGDGWRRGGASRV